MWSGKFNCAFLSSKHKPAFGARPGWPAEQEENVLGYDENCQRNASKTYAQFCCKISHDALQPNNKGIVDIRLRPRAGAVPGEPVWVYAAVSNRYCRLVSRFDPHPTCVACATGPIVWRYDVLQKPEVHNVSQCHQRKTEPRPQVTCTTIWWRLELYFQFGDMLTDRQTDWQTHKQTCSSQYVSHYPVVHMTCVYSLNNTYLFLPSSRSAKYCDQRVCICRVCLCDCVSKKTRPNFMEFSTHVARGRGSVLLWPHCNMLCVSGFVPTSHFQPTHQRAAARRDLMFMIALLSDAIICCARHSRITFTWRRLFLVCCLYAKYQMCCDEIRHSKTDRCRQWPVRSAVFDKRTNGRCVVFGKLSTK